MFALIQRHVASVGALAVVLVAAPGDARAADVSSDATAECIQASDRGQSQRDEGKYRAARTAFLQCSRDVCPQLVLKSCARWLRELDEAAPTIVPGAKDEQGNDVADASVTFDGEPLASHLDGRPVEVDSGEHVLKFERAGTTPVEQRLILRAGEKARVVTVTLRAVHDDSAGPPDGGDHPPPPPPPLPEPLMSPRHIVSGGLGLGAVGALGAGIAFVVQGNQKGQRAANMRGGLPSNACTGVSTPMCQSLSDAVQAQHSDANVAAGLFVGAGVLAAGAVAAWLFWPRRDTAPASPSVGVAALPQGGALYVAGSLW
jgi:hypothetical protein